MTSNAPSALRKLGRIALMVVGPLAILGFGYLAGAFVTSFDANMCYSNAISDVADEARFALTTGSPAAEAKFQHFMKSLPLAGYETSCSSLQTAIEKNKTPASARTPNQRLERP